jgi:outer membrane lipoprotein-sorting protein
MGIDMNKIRIVALVISMLFLGNNVYADNPSADEILQKVIAKYETMETYKAVGTINDVRETIKDRDIQEIPFSFILKKPNMYLITWSWMHEPPDERRFVATWSDGTQPYFYYSIFTAIDKMESDKMVLKRAQVNHGPFDIIPSLFLPVFRNGASLSWLKDPKIEKVEKIGEEECYVISGKSVDSRREILWISKSTYLVRKYNRFEDYLDLYNFYKHKIPELTDKEIEEKVDRYKQMNDTRFYSEVYTEISSPELNKKDFNYTVPEGTGVRENWYK